MPRVSEPHRSFALSPHPPGVVFTMYEMWGSPQNEGSLHRKARKMYEKWWSPHQNMDSMMPRNISAILHCRVTCRYIFVDNSKEIQPAYIFMILCGDPHISYKNHGIECKLGQKTRRPLYSYKQLGNSSQTGQRMQRPPHLVPSQARGRCPSRTPPPQLVNLGLKRFAALLGLRRRVDLGDDGRPFAHVRAMWIS